MRIICLILAWFASFSAALAQKPTAVQPPLVVAAVTQTDSVVALRHYYKTKRTQGAVITVGMLSFPAILYIDGANSNDPLGKGIAQGLVPFAFAYPLTAWLLHRKFNHRHEERAVQALEAGNLSAKARRRSKPKYFRS